MHLHLPKKMHIRPPKIHWKKYIERKVLILGGVVLASYVAERHGIHHSLVTHIHEFSATVFLEHTLIGIPFAVD